MSFLQNFRLAQLVVHKLRFSRGIRESMSQFNIRPVEIEEDDDTPSFFEPPEETMNKTSKKENMFLRIGDFNVFSWALSGVESSIVVKGKDGFSCCFDMGYASRESVSCSNILISHGHMDHISAVPQHIKKREQNGAKSATYHVPEMLVEPLKTVTSQFAAMNGGNQALEAPDIRGCNPGDKIQLDRGYFAVPFPTVHRVTSQGYIIYKARKHLKDEFLGLSPREISEKIHSGVNVHDIEITPEIAYTGDTTFQVFTDEVFPPPSDLFKVKLLIVEATYINLAKPLKDCIEQARKYGHIHLSELYDNADKFRDIQNILLVHFSDKYSVRYIQEQVFGGMPLMLKDKVIASTLAKERYV